MSAHPESIDLRQLIEPLVRHKSLIVTFCLSATISSLAFTYVVSEKYLATTTILYQPREAVSFRPKVRDALGFPMPLVALESIGNTLEEVVKSDGVLARAVRALHLDMKVTRPAPNRFVAVYRGLKDRVKEWREDAWEILKYGRLVPRDPIQQATQSLRQNLAIVRTSKAYTFELLVLDPDPARAALIVDTVAQILSDFLTAEQVKEARESRQTMEPRLRQSSSEIAEMRKTLEAVKSRTGVSSLAEELSLKLKALNELQQDLTGAQNELRSLENKRAALDAQLNGEQPSVKYSSTTSDNPLVEQLRLDLARLDVERSGLLENYTPNHQDVKALDAKIQEIRRRLGREAEKTVSSESVRVNDIYQKVLSDKLANDAEIAKLTAKAQALASTIQQETATTRRLTQNEPRLNELGLQLKTAEQAYELLNEAYEEARLTESKETSELAVLSKAVAPTAPARPIKILHLGTSFFLSLALAVGFVFFLNAFDSSIRSIDQVERVLGLPVFATIPMTSGAVRHPEKLLINPW